RGKCRHDEDAVVAEKHGAVLALLDNDKLRPHLHDQLACLDQIVLVCQKLSFAIVEQQAVKTRQELQQVVAKLANPQVHSVGHDKLGLPHLVENLGLRRWPAIGQKDVLAIAKILRQLRLKGLQDIEVDFKCIARVHVLVVTTLPGKSLAPLRDQTREINAPIGEEPPMFVGKVLANDADKLRLGKKAGRPTKITGRAAEDIVHGATGCLNRIEGDGTDDEEGHG